ncbi:MAG: hydroxyacid dehydrogenase [Herpetosiphon sp.]
MLVLLRPALYQELFTAELSARLRATAQVTLNTEERNWSSHELAQRLGRFEAVITGWGSPTFTPEVLDAAGSLRLIAHSAGSIKQMLPPPVFKRELAVTHAAAAIAPSVAETTLLLALLCLRPIHQYDRILQSSGSWEQAKAIPMPRELAGQRVGIIGASYTGRQVIKLLKAIGCEVWVYDPYLATERARELQVTPMGLDALLGGCNIVSVHAPVTAETHHMLGARELALLPDGAVFLNVARSLVVDEAALLHEINTRRIRIALDVFDDEPLPVNSPFRGHENVIITPHIAGASRQARQRQGEIIVAELERFFAGQPLHYPVTGAMLETMA